MERHVGHHGDGNTAPVTVATLDVMGQREPVRACPASGSLDGHGDDDGDGDGGGDGYGVGDGGRWWLRHC